ncbi:hypothetical protein J2X72_001115 [Phyllobacterium sp. 1468]|uniref:hypothetical protein n=1 Tax=Phyllobacterium sp. 1468 TaxID=2817759 RepID=UPI0028584AEB|nr:hypothetical protein [Phyllobacterium sp. 1468]MDR6632331.1 hypothetical protein [Phyllobacterium sp. 1468]
MKFVSARYSNAENDQIIAIDEEGRESVVPVNSDHPVWTAYVEEGGAIDEYIKPSTHTPDIVSSRQFFLQLAVSGLSSQVSAWVAQQDELTQIAFNKSATFRRDDVMLQQGFAGLGFTTGQVDEFFLSASLL